MIDLTSIAKKELVVESMEVRLSKIDDDSDTNRVKTRTESRATASIQYYSEKDILDVY